MTTKVVHCKKEPYDIYIGRKCGILEKSIWHNPFKESEYGRDGCINKYMVWLNTKPELLKRVGELKDKTLGCYCFPKNCHGNVLARHANSKWIMNWFSNMMFLEHPIIYQGISFLTVENFYQAMKLPKDRVDLRKEIAKLLPHKSKTEIRNVDKYKWREDWDEGESLKVMEYALRQKFGVKGYQQDLLLLSEDWDIVEWNNWNDTFWGKDINTGKGENHLGRLIMKIRAELRSV